MGLETAHVSNRTCMHTPCYDLLSWIDPCYDNSSQKWPKMVTAVYLLTNSSETKVVSNLKKAYSSEGVPTLNVASKVEFPKSLWSTLQSHKVQEAKMADFWAFSRPAHSQKTAHQVSKLSQVRQRIPKWW